MNPAVSAKEIERRKYVAPHTLLDEIASGRRRATPVLLRDLKIFLEEGDRGFSATSS